MGNCSITRGPEGHRHSRRAMQRGQEVIQRQHNGCAALDSHWGKTLLYSERGRPSAMCPIAISTKQLTPDTVLAGSV